jgi:peptidoglycan/xylan/chitin deacetylase (PgdA/CDA1 family)
MSTTQEPRVAVIIPCYDGGPTVREAVASVLAQDTPVELVVIDDGSPDPETVRVLDALRDEGVRVLRQENAGLGGARMAGVAATSAPLILPLDCDDVLLPGAVAHLVALLDAHPDAVVAWGGYRRFGHEHTVQPLAPTLDAWQLTYMNELPATALIRREALEATPGWRLRGNYEDWDFWLTLVERGYTGVGTPSLTFGYRRVGTGMLHGAQTQHEAHYERLRSLHADLFARRRALWRRSRAPWLLRLTLPVVEQLPVSREKKRFAGSILSHLAHRRGLGLLVRRVREVRATQRRTAATPMSGGRRGDHTTTMLDRMRVSKARRSRIRRRLIVFVERPRSSLLEKLLRGLAGVIVRLQRLRGPGTGMAVVYHRLAETAGDARRELLPAISVRHFGAQVDLLAQHYDIVSAAELPAAARNRARGARLPLAITFDDDDPSHVDWAAPALRERGLPATFFLCGASLDVPRAFWWEHLQTLFDRGLPTPPGLPSDLFAAANAIVNMTPDERDRVDAEMRAILGPEPERVGLSREKLVELASEFEIGFHTADHHPLDTLSDDQLADALRTGREILESAIGRPCTAIAYPNGRSDARTARAVEAAGFDAGYTTQARPLRPSTDRRLIGRLEGRSGSLGLFALRLALLPARRGGTSY